MRKALKNAAIICAALCGALFFGHAKADNQTPTTSPITVGAQGLPFRLELQRVDTAGRLPTLQSFVAGRYGNLWVLIGGRTNGLHDFTDDPLTNFPPSAQNAHIWVIDPMGWQVWSRSLRNSGLTRDQVDQLSATNHQSVQSRDTLYIVGGYGFSRSSQDFVTFPVMTAVDLPALVNWVLRPSQSPPLPALLRQTRNEILRVTGGQMALFGRRAILAFGHDFAGGYGSSEAVQTYTGQVRSFSIVDAGGQVRITNLQQSPQTPDLVNYRRRDLPMVSFIDGTGNKVAALAGVFTSSFGVFTVPVEIGPAGVPSQADPQASSTFKQGMNGYDCATLGVYDAASGATHSILFGGISYLTYNWGTGTFFADPNFPFTNQITNVVRDRDGRYTQYLLPTSFPVVSGPDVARYRFGAEAEVFLKTQTPTRGHDLIDLAALRGRPGSLNVVGWVFGGIAAEQGNGGQTVASNEVFKIVLLER